MLQFAVGAAVSLGMVLWRYFRLKESKVRARCMVVAGRMVGKGAGARGNSPCRTYMGPVTAVCHA